MKKRISISALIFLVQTLVFLSGGGIGNGQQRSKPDNYSPHWSPDGKRMVGLIICLFSAIAADAALEQTSNGTSRQYLHELKTGIEHSRLSTSMIADAQQPVTQPVINGGRPLVSPDGSHIAFISNRAGNDDVYVMRADGTDEKQLTHTPEDEGNLGWTTDGRRILFSVTTGNTSHFYSIDLNGKNQREIVSVEGRAPTLSPDGKRLLYMAGTFTAVRLMVSAVDGSNAQQITDGSSIAWNNHWSPDGKRIAFTGRNDPKSELAVFIMNPDGSERRQVTHIPLEEGGAQSPAWSPDGHQLTIQVNSRKQKNTAHIWVVDVVTGEAHKLAAHDQPYLDETPSWFPDGKRIAFQSNRSGRMEVWVMNADGSGQKQVTH